MKIYIYLIILTIVLIGCSNTPRVIPDATEYEVDMVNQYENLIVNRVGECKTTHVIYKFDAETISHEAFIEKEGEMCKIKSGNYPLEMNWCYISLGQAQNITNIQEYHDVLFGTCG